MSEPVTQCRTCGTHWSILADGRCPTCLLNELTEITERHVRVMEERCPTDERHCTCVPMLRGEVERLRAGKHDRLEEARLTKHLMEAQQECERLRAALKPFAQVAERIPPAERDEFAWHHDHLVKHYRAARDAAGGGDGGRYCL